MGKTTEISWLHYLVPESRFPAGRSLPERVWLEGRRSDGMLNVLGATFNPWIGCTPAQHPNGPVAQGCVNCYAAALNERFRWAHTLDKDGKKVPAWGKGAPRKLASESTWKQAFGWARDAARLGLRRRWFFSLGDPLDPEVPEDWRQRLWEFIRRTSHLDVLNAAASGEDWSGCFGGLDAYLLTKRPWLWEVIPEDVRPLIRLGTSASDPASWDLWVGDLVKARGFAGLFVSLEPMVESVDLFKPVGVMGDSGRVIEQAAGQPRYAMDCPRCQGTGYFQTDPEVVYCSGCRGRKTPLDQVIVGGESGPKARPFNLSWARSVRDQCRAAGVRYFLKQLGSRPMSHGCDWEDIRGDPGEGAHTDPAKWPEDLRVQEVP